MMARMHTGKTPFCLAFRSEAIIPTEVGLTRNRVAYHVKGRNEEGIRLQLDLLDEVKATTEQWIMCYLDLMSKHYHTKVRPQHLKNEDLILRKVTTATKDPIQGKLRPN